MTRLRRRGDASRSEHGQPDAVTYVRRQRCDSTRNCVGIEVGLEDRAGSSCASSSYRRVPELTRGSSHISLRGPVLRADGAAVTEIRVNSISEQRIKGLDRNVDTRSQVTHRRKNWRPGQAVKLVDVQNMSCIPDAPLEKGRLVEDIDVGCGALPDELDNVNSFTLLSPSEKSPISTSQEFGPSYPQRKKLVAPRTPLTPASQLTVMQTPMRKMKFQSRSESPLERLPVELLVHIVCRLHHDQLKPVFHVCRSLQQAVSIARQMHFNFTTPDYERQKTVSFYTPKRHRDFYFTVSEAPGGTLDVRPPTPQAPRHPPKPQHARIPLADMKAIVAPLFQGPRDTPHRPPGIPRPTFKAVASHRVLFNEEEFRDAGAPATVAS